MQSYRKISSKFIFLPILVLLCACSDKARDYGFELSDLAATVTDNQAQISSQFNIRLSDAARLALERGIPLTLRIQFRARKDSRLPGSTIAATEHVYQMTYLPLSEHYVLTDMVTGIQQTYPRLRYLISSLQNQEQVMSLGDLAPGNYLIQVRAELDLRKLPAPMRLPARIAPEWRLSTDWHSWPFDVRA